MGEKGRAVPEMERGVHPWGEILLLSMGFLVLFFSIPHEMKGDGLARFQALSALLGGGKIPDLKYSMVGTLLAAPLWFLGKTVETPEWWVSRFNLLVFFSGMGLAWWILKDRAPRKFLLRFFLLLTFASMFPRHLEGFHGEVFTAVCAGVGILGITQGKERLGWALLALGTANTPAALPGLGLVVLFLFWERRRRPCLLVPLLVLSLVLAENWIRKGHPFHTGYEGDKGFKTLLPFSGLPGFSFPFFLGLLSILLSFGKGILWFAPGLLLSSWKKDTSFPSSLLTPYRLFLLFLAGLVLVYSKWWCWYGGWFWGPRFFLFASIPASLALAAALSKENASSLFRAWTLLLLAWSFWVGVSGVVFDQYGLGLCRANGYFLESWCWYLPQFNVLFHPFIDPKPLVDQDLFFLTPSVAAFLYLFLPSAARLLPQVGREWLAPLWRKTLNRA